MPNVFVNPRLFGIFIEVNASQFLNVLVPNTCKFPGKVTFESFVHSENAYCPISVIVSGITMDVNPVQITAILKGILIYFCDTV